MMCSVPAVLLRCAHVPNSFPAPSTPLSPCVHTRLLMCARVVLRAVVAVVGVQALLAWNYEVTRAALEVFTKAAQGELRGRGGYLVEHVSGFMLSAFRAPAAALLWGLRMQELMLHEAWCVLLVLVWG